jgi:hypothetical protein
MAINVKKESVRMQGRECMWKTLLKGWGSRCAQVDDSRIKKQEHGSKKEVGNGSVLGCPCDKCSLWGGQELQT